jgi:dihydropteroate synthase
LGVFSRLGFPLLAGVSRKSFLGTITGQPDPDKRLVSSVTAGLWCALHGARILRVHDVRETCEALMVLNTIEMSGLRPQIF